MAGMASSVPCGKPSCFWNSGSFSFSASSFSECSRRALLLAHAAPLPRPSRLAAPSLSQFGHEPFDLCPVEMRDAANFCIGEPGLVLLCALPENAEHPCLGGFPVDASVTFRVAGGREAPMKIGA